MRIGFTQPYSDNEVIITGYHDAPEEIKNLEQYTHINIPQDLVIPSGSMAIYNYNNDSYRFIQCESSCEQEIEDVLFSTYDDMLTDMADRILALEGA